MIQIKELSKSFSETSTTYHVLQNINLHIHKNECVVIKGESGSGKSTLLSIIASIMKPTSGKVLVDGENIVSFSDIHTSEYRKKRVGFITQNFNLFDELSVENNLLASLVIQNISQVQIQERIDIALTTARIDHKSKQKAYSLSGGEKQRCIIARAIVNDPDIIICDEPTANLDLENSLFFIETIKHLKQCGKTIIIATHDQLFDSLDFIDTTLIMDNGTLG